MNIFIKMDHALEARLIEYLHRVEQSIPARNALDRGLVRGRRILFSEGELVADIHRLKAILYLLGYDDPSYCTSDGPSGISDRTFEREIQPRIPGGTLVESARSGKFYRLRGIRELVTVLYKEGKLDYPADRLDKILRRI